MRRRHWVTGALIAGIAGGALWAMERARWQSMVVTATAYNSLPAQTTAKNPDLAAWGDRLKPGMRAIAVSRDLIPEGLGHGTRVRIAGLDGEWLVLDKMHRRWQRKIDIYMGTDVQAAREWGRREVTISWRADEDDD